MTELSVSRFNILDEEDIIHTRRVAREQAEQLGFSIMDKTRVATAVSELARNVFHHGGGGYMEIEAIHREGQRGLRCVFIDEGPGIVDIELALTDGYTTGNTLGHGLPGAKRLVDELTITPNNAQGARVEMVKWCRT